MRQQQASRGRSGRGAAKSTGGSGVGTPGPAPAPWLNKQIPGQRLSPRSGRGALSNESGRYEKEARWPERDGWDFSQDLPPLRTEVAREQARSIITRNDSPDISFGQSINPYRGCEHGCVYCYARPTHAYLGLSPGLDFETKLFAKVNAASLLERELAAPGYVPKVIALGTNTDPYQPTERKERIMRAVLEVLARTNHPVSITTKSALVLRDLDLLVPMAEKGLASVALSITTLDPALARTLEPRAASPRRRLEAIFNLARAKEMGTSGAGYVLLRLPLEVKELFEEWLAAHYPGKLKHVLSLVRAARGGKLYDSTFGERMRGTGAYAQMIARRFETACARLGLSRNRGALRCDLFAPPGRVGEQLRLF